MEARQKIGLTFSLHQKDVVVRRETLWQDIVKVGRDARCHLRVDDELASRVHALIEVVSPGDITLIDLGSEPGTMVNGVRVNRWKLRPGEYFQVGMTRIVLDNVERWAAVAAEARSTGAAPPGQEDLRAMILDRHPGASGPVQDQIDVDFPRIHGLRALGYWAPGSFPDLPQAQHFVDPSWDPNERDAVFAYLRLGEMVLPWKGYSWCRFDCGLVEPGHVITEEDIEWLFSAEEELLPRARSRFPAAPISLAELLRELRAEPDTLGSACLSDGHFVWPEGLAHYVDKHSVRLPEEFVGRALHELSLHGIRIA